MKKTILSLLLFATAQLSYCQLFTINAFTQIEKVNGSIQLTTPINVQYALKQSLKPDFYSLFSFEAVGLGHSFNGSGIVVNDIPIVAGIGVKPSASQPITVGMCAGVNAWNGKFIMGINTDVELQPLVTATSRTLSPKKKHNLSISL